MSFFMFLMTKAGRRGCVWGLVVCPYWGRQHSIMKRVRKASNFERLVISVRFVPVYQLHLLQKPCKEEVCHCPSDASRSIPFSSFSFCNIAMSDAKILKDIPSCASTCFQSPLSLPLLFRLRLSSPAFQE